MSVIEAPYEMSNLFPKHTGLPFTVWISVKGGARHDVRVKVSRTAKATPQDMVSVAIRPRVRVVAGKLDAHELALLSSWIELNRPTLIAYWAGEIDTQDAITALRRI
jgi:hypothetical protein